MMSNFLKKKYFEKLPLNESLVIIISFINILFFFLRINGLMTIRNAIILCETDNNCAGFTYKGAIWDLDEIYDVYFFK